MAQSDLILAKVVQLGQRFYPSESAFPLRECCDPGTLHPFLHFLRITGLVATLLVRFMLSNKGTVPLGWSPRILVQCGVPFVEVWDVFHEMYESQVRMISTYLIKSPRRRVFFGRFHLSTIKRMSRQFRQKLLFYCQIGSVKRCGLNHRLSELNFLLDVLILRSTSIWSSWNQVVPKQERHTKTSSGSSDGTGNPTVHVACRIDTPPNTDRQPN